MSDAAYQADNWTDGFVLEILQDAQGKSDASKAMPLSNLIDDDRRREVHWEESIWTIPNSELLPGESIWQHVGAFVMVEGTGSTMHQRFATKCEANPKECSTPDTTTISYVVDAELDVRARILTERLRQAIAHFAAVLQYRGKPKDGDPFITSWNTAWFPGSIEIC